jgi:hypothetical protein
MTADERRLARLRRLERVRSIAKRQLAAETAEAEAALSQLRALTDRTKGLAEEYAARNDAFDGFILQQTGRFAAGLCQVARSAGLGANAAQERADKKLAELATAEQRRAAVEERITFAEALLSKRGAAKPVEARRKIGTELE